MPRKKLGDSVVESLGENFVIVICLRITVYGGGSGPRTLKICMKKHLKMDEVKKNGELVAGGPHVYSVRCYCVCCRARR